MVRYTQLSGFQNRSFDFKTTARDMPPDAGFFGVSGYYPFSMIMGGRSYKSDEYRFGFNGQEKETEITNTESHYSAEYWMYDSRIERRWNTDPKYLANECRYTVNGNNPNYYTDPKGDFKTETGAKIYNFFTKGKGTVTQAQSGNRAGEWYVSKEIDGGVGAKGRGKLADGTIELDEVVVIRQVK